MRALGYMDWDQINTDDIYNVRRVVIWLEDQRIRHYTIDDRKRLRDITANDWPQTFEKYCKDVECPITTNMTDQLEWLAGYAVWLEFGDNRKKYEQILESKSKAKNEGNIPNTKPRNPIDNLDFNSDVFKTEVHALAKLLKVELHPDHLIMLQGCTKLVCNKYDIEIFKQPMYKPHLDENVGSMTMLRSFNMGEVMLDKAAKGLSLLYIQDLRNLQTKINETIVAVQNITADPKTDTKLGQVGK